MGLICWSKNEENLKRATSGGIMFELARFIITKEHGYVVGVDKNGLYQITNKLEKVKSFQGSKYCRALGIKPLCNKINKIKKPILFIGLPCEIELFKKIYDDKNNIYYITLKCHGIPKYGNFTRCNAKQYGWSKSWKVLPKKYLKNKNLNKQCKKCKISRFNGDITIGDAWNAPKHLWNEYGTSEIKINTAKGLVLFVDIYDNIIFHNSKENEKNKIALLDVHDHHNFGNCLIAANFIKEVRKYLPLQKFVFIEKRADCSYKKIEQMTGIKKDEGIEYRSISLLDDKPRELLKTWFDLSVLKDCDTVVVLGGDTFSYKKWRQRWTYWLLYLYMIQRANKNVYFMPCTIGNIPFYVKPFFKIILKRCKQIYVRDWWSYHNLRYANLHNLSRYSDLAYLSYNDEFKLNRKEYGAIIVPSADWWQYSNSIIEYIYKLSYLIKYFKERHNNINLMAHEENETLEVIMKNVSELTHCNIIKTPKNPDEARKELAKSNINICFRMHSAIQSRLVNVPYIVIDGKTNNHKINAVIRNDIYTLLTNWFLAKQCIENFIKDLNDRRK